MFARAHQANLAEAHDALAAGLVATHGEDGSHRALDRIGVRIANRYGDGHPTLGCSDLKEVTLELAMSQDRANLSRMADRLLREEAGAPPEGLRAEAEAPAQGARHLRSKHRAQVPYEMISEEPEPVEAQLPDAMQMPLWQRG